MILSVACLHLLLTELFPKQSKKALQPVKSNLITFLSKYLFPVPKLGTQIPKKLGSITVRN